LVWVFALAYVGFMGLFVVLFGIRRGEGASWSWMATCVIQVGKEILVSGPLTVFFVNTMVPRFMAPIIKLLQSTDPMVPHEGALSVRIVDAFHRDIELRAAAAKLLVEGGEFGHIEAEKLATKLGVDRKRWLEETREEREAAEAAELDLKHRDSAPKITNVVIPSHQNMELYSHRVTHRPTSPQVVPLKVQDLECVPYGLQQYAIGKDEIDGGMVFGLSPAAAMMRAAREAEDHASPLPPLTPPGNRSQQGGQPESPSQQAWIYL
jgi:hypothetical protein